MRGLVSAERAHLAPFDTAHHTFLEAVVGAASPLLGRTLAEAEFRERYQAAVVAIHRAGQRVGEKLGQVRLKVGDTLLLLADPGFAERWRDRNDFLVVSRLGGAPPSSSGKAVLVAGITLAIVAVNVLGLMPLLEASLLGAIALVALGVLSPREARSAVDLDVIVMIAASFALAAAIERSGLGARIAASLVTGLGGLGTTGVLLGVLLAALAFNTFVNPGRHGGPGLSHRDVGCGRAGREPAALRPRPRRDGAVVVPDAGGLRLQHDGVRPWRVSFRRLRATRGSAHGPRPRRRARRGPGAVAGVAE